MKQNRIKFAIELISDKSSLLNHWARFQLLKKVRCNWLSIWEPKYNKALRNTSGQHKFQMYLRCDISRRIDIDQYSNNFGLQNSLSIY